MKCDILRTKYCPNAQVCISQRLVRIEGAVLDMLFGVYVRELGSRYSSIHFGIQARNWAQQGRPTTTCRKKNECNFITEFNNFYRIRKCGHARSFFQERLAKTSPQEHKSLCIMVLREVCSLSTESISMLSYTL